MTSVLVVAAPDHPMIEGYRESLLEDFIPS